jgi:hypothetical protein
MTHLHICVRMLRATTLILGLLSGLFFLACSLHGRHLRAGVTGVWAIDESEKIRATDVDHWGKTDRRNAVWDGEEIRMFGARNEVIGCQVILEATGLGAERVALRLDSLSSGTFTIDNARTSMEPFDYVGKCIEFFTESYRDIQERSEWWLPSARPLPDEAHKGWIPDALVPAATQGSFVHGTDGFPFSIAPGQLQGVWLDIYVPREAPPGEFRGTLEVLERDTVRYSVPISLHVYGFSLSDTTHLHNHFFWGLQTITERHGVRHDSPEYWKLFRNYENTFHRHRLDLIDGRRTLNDFRRHLAGYYTGKAYLPTWGYDGPGLGVGNGTYSIGTYDQPSSGWISGFWPDTESAWQASANAWQTWFADYAPACTRFKYMEDEPPFVRWGEVARKAKWLRDNPGPGKTLDVLATTRIAPALYGLITYWMVSGHSGWKDSGGTTGFDLPVVRERQALGEHVGLYNGQRPSYGEPNAVDDFATDARVNPWICWKYHVDMYFYWETAYFAASSHNIWTAQYPGSLLYTGEDVKFPKDSRGLKGPIMSIRLKNFRRGVQDYEYLWLARAMGISTDSLVDTIVPAAFNDYNGSSYTSQSDQPTWAQRGYAYERVRKSIAEAIERRLQSGK